MKILINAINIHGGGGKQVTDSIFKSLSCVQDHHFIVVLSTHLRDIIDERIASSSNVEVFVHTISNRLSTLLFGRDAFMDRLVKTRNVDAVLTVFGPSRWIPKVTHLSGFARAQLLDLNTPYYQRTSLRERLFNRVVKWSFKRCSDNYWTESGLISERLKVLFPKKRVYTVYNTYNQVFLRPNDWTKVPLASFPGSTILVITGPGMYKNSSILIPISRYLQDEFPDFKFRFIVSMQKEAFVAVPNDLIDHFVFIGEVGITDLPSLYSQSDILFQPSLLECFTATYPEAMKMRVPILTTDLDFSHSICGDAAMYYSCLDHVEAAQKLYSLATDHLLRKSLLEKSDVRCKAFISAEERTSRLIGILEELNEIE